MNGNKEESIYRVRKRKKVKVVNFVSYERSRRRYMWRTMWVVCWKVLFLVVLIVALTFFIVYGEVGVEGIKGFYETSKEESSEVIESVKGGIEGVKTASTVVKGNVVGKKICITDYI